MPHAIGSGSARGALQSERHVAGAHRSARRRQNGRGSNRALDAIRAVPPPRLHAPPLIVIVPTAIIHRGRPRALPRAKCLRPRRQQAAHRPASRSSAGPTDGRGAGKSFGSPGEHSAASARRRCRPVGNLSRTRGRRARLHNRRHGGLRRREGLPRDWRECPFRCFDPEGRSSWPPGFRGNYFGSDTTGRFEIWRIRAAGGEALRITEHGGLTAIGSPRASRTPNSGRR
jgi:hypothetical protein